MRPTNKFQRHIVDIDKSLPKLTPSQKHWAKQNCLMHLAVLLKSGKTTCLDCGTSWQSTANHNDKITCPNCKQELRVELSRHKNFRDDNYCTILSRHKDFQIIRKVECKGFYKRGSEAKIFITEVGRIYIDKNGKYAIVGHSMQDTWNGERWFGEFALKHNNTIKAHSRGTIDVYPRQKLIPEIIRNGYTGDTHTLTHFNFIQAILRNPKSETLLKAGQFNLFRQSADYYGTNKVERYWNSIKICIRQNYIVENASDYFDHLELLFHFGKDLKNPKYICPANFQKEHQKYIERKRKKLLKIKISEMKEQLETDQKDYELKKKKYFGLSFTDGKITINVIEKVVEVMKLGDYFNHCIYENEYYKKQESLLLCASIDKIPMETIEFDLNTLTVVQSRGAENESSEFNYEIVKLMNDNRLELSEQRLKRRKKRKQVA